MQRFTRWIVTKFIKNHQNINDLVVRAKYGSLEGWVSIVINIVLFAIKIIAGLSINSVALIADAVHTLSEFIKELLARFSFELGDIIDSKTLKADALHHRSDVIATGLVVDIALAKNTDEQDIYDIVDSVQAQFKNIFPQMKTVIMADLKYTYSLSE